MAGRRRLLAGGAPSAAAEELAATDLVLMIATAGADVPYVGAIGRACSERRVQTATIVMRTPATTEEALSHSLAHVRPWSLMVVVVSDEDSVEDLLSALR